MSDEQTRRYATVADILGAADIETEDLYVPEWDLTVRVKAMTAAERDGFEQSCFSGKGKHREVNLANARAKLAVRTLVDETGKRLFTDIQAHDLAAKSAAALNRVWDVATRLSGIGDEDVEDLAGNSEAGQNDDSPSA